jgi:hypothetical protein
LAAEGTGQLTGDGSGRVSVLTEVGGLQDRPVELRGSSDRPKGRFQRVDHIA